MIYYDDVEAVINVYINRFKKISDKYNVGECNDEIGYCNSSLNMLHDILRCCKLLDKLDNMEARKDISLGDDFLVLLDETNVQNNLISAILENRGVYDER